MNGFDLLVRVLLALAISVLVAIAVAPWLLGFYTIVRELLLK